MNKNNEIPNHFSFYSDGDYARCIFIVNLNSHFKG